MIFFQFLKKVTRKKKGILVRRNHLRHVGVGKGDGKTS